MSKNTRTSVTSLDSEIEFKIIVQNGTYGVSGNAAIKRARTELQPSTAALAAVFNLMSEARKALGGNDTDNKASDNSETISYTGTTTFEKVLKFFTHFEMNVAESAQFKEKRNFYEQKRRSLGLGSNNKDTRLIGEQKANALEQLKKHSFACTTVWIQVQTPVSNDRNLIETKHRHFLAGYSDDQVESLLQVIGLTLKDVKKSGGKKKTKPTDSEESGTEKELKKPSADPEGTSDSSSNKDVKVNTTSNAESNTLTAEKTVEPAKDASNSPSNEDAKVDTASNAGSDPPAANKTAESAVVAPPGDNTNGDNTREAVVSTTQITDTESKEGSPGTCIDH